MSILEQLQEMRDFGRPARTIGLPDRIILRFAEEHPDLRRAVDEALARHRELQASRPEILALDEPAEIRAIQSGVLNFYAEDAVNPYVALAARGPWIVTSKGAVIHDSGGYGMLGLGHAPEAVLRALDRPHVMANIMTASYSQLALVEALRREIGHRRKAGSPFERFVFLNSGSEAVTLAARISDIHAKLQTDPGGRHADKKIKILGLAGAFHGRTHRPAQVSDSTRGKYQAHLASFRGRDNLLIVEPNRADDLRRMVERAEREDSYIEAVYLEPVMGEGNPGLGITREFYDAARQLTRDHGSLLIVDSIQAGLRAHGCLSIVDYPGFEDCEPPDMEAYSKALNAGQYPLSVLALTEQAAQIYRKGVYGNTMTANPRAMEVACAVLASITPTLRENIRARGAQLVEGLRALQRELNGSIIAVQGTGLLVSCGLAPAVKSHGSDSVEEAMRLRGIGVIHGGKNALRFTPYFAITAEEIELILQSTREALLAAEVAESI